MVRPSKIIPIVYVGAIKDKVNIFNALPEVSGKYWDQTTDGVLSDLKKAIKDYYLVAQDFTCAYCRQRIEVAHNGAWDADHIVPKDTHPRFMFEPRNLCVSCKDCNGNKSNKNVLVNKRRVKFPIKSEDYLLCHPHYDNYDEHVSVLSVAGFYLPKTEKGRALVEVCGLLRFLYKFSGFQSVNDDLKIKMGKLNALLMEANDSATENYILDCIEDLARRGKEESRKKLMNELMA
ncbi:HNH endonuclease [Pseudomonas sp. PGPPP2]|uniref:HNH endonuclease n=1 Tax=Pseudomonas sp. PGPPP2 TaxID=2015554 RepID=UPI000BD1E6F8|nr:HNH endonuclease [Pseudomonas sp. PGPPP2]OYT78262.1 MAG: HNH endonuclease [Pseudomonas sp. PGPPP2]